MAHGRSRHHDLRQPDRDVAAVGWPVSELVHYDLMENPSPQTYDFHAAPSVLNGGLENSMILLGLGLFFAIGSALELELIKRKQKENILAEEFKNFFDMWYVMFTRHFDDFYLDIGIFRFRREDGWDVPGNYGFGMLSVVWISVYFSFS